MFAGFERSNASFESCQHSTGTKNKSQCQRQVEGQATGLEQQGIKFRIDFILFQNVYHFHRIYILRCLIGKYRINILIFL